MASGYLVYNIKQPVNIVPGRAQALPGIYNAVSQALKKRKAFILGNVTINAGECGAFWCNYVRNSGDAYVMAVGGTSTMTRTITVYANDTIMVNDVALNSATLSNMEVKA